MLTDEDVIMLLYLVRERAASLREEQRRIEKMRVNLKCEDFMQNEYIEYCSELINLHMLFTKLCHIYE